MKRHLLAAALLAAASSATAFAAEPAALALETNARLRYESVDDDAFARDAQATTLRLRTGLRWTITPAFAAFVEGEAVGSLDDGYNSGANRRTMYPVINDPASVELNQAWLGYRGKAFEATAGRQRLLFDNQRWIGNVGWRQNEQTFDAVALQLTPSKPVTVRYAWIDRVHRVASDRAVDPLARERDLDTHAINAAWTHGAQRLAGYAYLHEDRDVAAASTRTLGIRYALSAGKTQPFGLTLEAARQEEYADNPMDFSHSYWLAEPAYTVAGTTLRAGWEHLGGNGRHALQTPLATLHAFNGWADKFLTTPPAGLEDRYVSANGTLLRTRAAGAMEWTVAWHDYRADAGSQRYGRELDASVALPLGHGFKGMAKVADYRADRFARDTTKVWLQLEWAPKAWAIVR